MITYKQILLLLFFALTLIVPSCRKGENDPLISLRTRKARVTGLWKLESGTYNYVSPGIINLEVEYDGENATERLNGKFKEAYDYSIEFKISKNNTFERVIVARGFSKTEKGNWFFNKKSKELGLKNKEAIILSFTSVESSGITTTYSGARSDEILVIDRLKNDELIFKDEKTFSSTTTDTEKYEMKYFKF